MAVAIRIRLPRGRRRSIPAFGTFGTMDPGINSPRIQSWNVTVEQQLGIGLGCVGELSGQPLRSPVGAGGAQSGCLHGSGAVHASNGVTYPVCSTNANLNFRRALYQQNPREAGLIGALDFNTDVGYQNYRGLKLSAQRRAARRSEHQRELHGVPVQGHADGHGLQSAERRLSEAGGPVLRRRVCDQDRTHIASLTTGYLTPEFSSAALSAIASNWRLSGILSARSGARLNVITGTDNAFTGIAAQRVNKVSDDFYAAEPTLTQYFNSAAFAQPAPGTLGDLERNAVVGPNFWNIDLAISRLVRLGRRSGWNSAWRRSTC